MGHPSNAVVHLQMRWGEKNLAVGTGVLYERKGEHFIVTAWHNVSGRHSETLECLHTDKSVPDNVVVTLSLTINSMGLIVPLSIVVPLQDSEKGLYYVHPQGYPRVDVVAIPLDFKASYAVLSGIEGHSMSMQLEMPIEGGGIARPQCIQESETIMKGLSEQWMASLDVGDELFIPGYPRGITDYLAQPLWKRATVASFVGRGWNRQPLFIVD